MYKRNPQGFVALTHPQLSRNPWESLWKDTPGNAEDLTEEKNHPDFLPGCWEEGAGVTPTSTRISCHAGGNGDEKVWTESAWGPSLTDITECCKGSLLLQRWREKVTTTTGRLSTPGREHPCALGLQCARHSWKYFTYNNLLLVAGLWAGLIFIFILQTHAFYVLMHCDNTCFSSFLLAHGLLNMHSMRTFVACFLWVFSSSASQNRYMLAHLLCVCQPRSWTWASPWSGCPWFKSVPINKGLEC